MNPVARALSWLLVAVAAIAALGYLHDPPWAGSVTSGLRRWTVERDGTPFRWTNGHASFFVPSDASVVIVPVRPGVPRPGGRPVGVSVSVDDRRIVTRRLDDPDRWVEIAMTMPGGPPTRRFRRVDVRVDGVMTQGNLGVQVGQVQLRRIRTGGAQ